MEGRLPLFQLIIKSSVVNGGSLASGVADLVSPLFLNMGIKMKGIKRVGNVFKRLEWILAKFCFTKRTNNWHLPSKQKYNTSGLV